MHCCWQALNVWTDGSNVAYSRFAASRLSMSDERWFQYMYQQIRGLSLLCALFEEIYMQDVWLSIKPDVLKVKCEG